MPEAAPAQIKADISKPFVLRSGHSVDDGGNEYLLDAYYVEVARAKVPGKVPISSNMPTNQNCSCSSCHEFNS